MPFLKKFKACPESKKKEQTTYKSGSRHTVYFLNGDRHIGEWRNNLKEGKGSEITRSGYLYEGDFAGELRHGHGVLSKQRPDGTFRLVYNGEWAHGKKHGYGIHRWEDCSWYDGMWQGGKRCGEGRMWFPDGTFYQGQWQDDKFHGSGLFVLPNGNHYEGEFYNGCKHGKGKFFHMEKGQLQEGVWDEDICVSSTVRSLEAPAPSVSTIPPNGLRDPEAVATESQHGALEKVRSKRFPMNSRSEQSSNPSFSSSKHSQ